jgi:CubicO group peptidase (beta-lactamase class C family)
MDSSRFDTIARRFADRRFSRRRALRQGSVGVAAVGLGVTFPGANLRSTVAHDSATPAAEVGSDEVEAIISLARDAMAKYKLKAVIVRVTVHGKEVVTAALGESMTGVPATPDMHFRNGAVAISYLSTLLLRLVDQGIVRLDDKLSTWMPELPAADRVTLRMLANMTAGYADHVQDEGFLAASNADPFRQWTPQELIAISIAKPHVFEPGTNWDYSHTGYVILGQALEKITGKPMATLMQEQILGPLGLTNTIGSSTPAIPEPVLHSFTSERRKALGVDSDVRFYEESTFWNPSWTIAEGAIQTTNIYDMTATAEAVGTGSLLSPESHRAQIAPDLLGFGSPLKGCPNCHTLDQTYNYGLGVVLAGPWLLQNPLFSGCGSLEAYLPSKGIAVAIAVTFDEESFDEQGNYLYGFASQNILAAIGAYLAPDAAPKAGG